MPERHKRAFEEYLRGRDTKKLFKGVRIDTPYGERKIIKCLPDRELLRITKDLAAEKALYTMDADQSGHIWDWEKKLIKQFEGVLAETFAHIALMCLLPQAAVDRFDLEREDFRYDVKEYDVRLRCGGQIYKFEVRNSNSYKTAIGEGYGSLDVLGAYVNKYKTRETLADYFIRPLLQSETLCPELPDHKNADELAEKLLGGRGACRVHGGGFAGTIQAFVPLDALEHFRRGMEAVLGVGSCHILSVRPEGGVLLEEYA